MRKKVSCVGGVFVFFKVIYWFKTVISAMVLTVYLFASIPFNVFDKFKSGYYRILAIHDIQRVSMLSPIHLP